MVKKYEVAIDENGIAHKCKMVDEEEYKKLKADSEKALEQKRLEKELLLETIEGLKARLDSLEQEIKVLKGED